nr:MAG TPA: hypothetical protein [Caudoviricetes sp.]
MKFLISFYQILIVPSNIASMTKVVINNKI